MDHPTRRRLAAGALAWLGTAWMPAWASPRHSLSMTMGGNPGGGYDQTGLALGQALAESGGAAQVTYEYKGGAGGTLALVQFVSAHRGDAGAMIVTGAVMVGATVKSRPPVTLSQATPIARLMAEYNIFVVPAHSPLRTAADLVQRLQTDAAGVTWGGGSLGSVDQISVAMLARAIGADPTRLRYLPFRGGGETTPALLGDSLTVAAGGIGEFESHLRAGRLHALAVTAPGRVDGLAVPTLREQGLDVVIGNWRGVHAAPGLSSPERQGLIDAVAAAARTPGWRASLAAHHWTDELLLGDAFAAFVEQETLRTRSLMADLGML